MINNRPVLRDARLKDFLVNVKTNSTHAIIAVDTLGIEWAAAQILDTALVTVVWRSHIIVWPNGALARLYIVNSEADFRYLHGVRLDSALLVHGSSDRHFPANLQAFLASRAAGPDFKVFNVTW